MPLILRSGFLAASRRMGCAALMVRDARRRAPHHEGQRTTLLRPIHHSPRFQLTLVISARLSAIIDPKRDAATCNTATAAPKPSRPQPLLAITAAVAGPPMRGCRISIMLENTTGNSAIMPLTLGPTHPDSVTTVATRVATSAARKGMSYQRRAISGILTCRKRLSSGMQIAKATILTARPLASDQGIVRDKAASRIQTAAPAD